MTPVSVDETIKSDLSEARRVQDDIEETLAGFGYSERDLFSVKLALEETLVNAIKHGNQLDPAKSVAVHYTVSSERFTISITDEGEGFDPAEVPDPTAPENLERPCGRGLLIVRRFMTTVEYHPPGNRVTMTKTRTASDP